MRLDYEERRAMLVLIAAPLEIVLEPDQEPQAIIREEDEVSILFTQEQAQALTSAINVLVTSGRPVCPLCGTPLEPGPHACVKQNGHREIVQVVEDEEEEE
jgi:hypothetical protein